MTNPIDQHINNDAKDSNNENKTEAINPEFKTLKQVKEEFVNQLGFDPSNLDDLSSHIDQNNVNLSEQVSNLLQLQQDMSDMLINRFQANMEAFKTYVPNIYEKFKDYTPSEPLEFMCTSNGIPNLFFPDRNEFFYKTYDPVALCNKQVDLVLEHCPFKQLNYAIDNEVLGQIHHRYLNEIVKYQQKNLKPIKKPRVTESTPVCIIAGVGLGYHIGHLCSKVQTGNLIIIEPNNDLFFASLHTFDWNNLLQYFKESNFGLYIMVGQSKDEVFEDLNKYYNRHGHMLACFMWSMVHYRSNEINVIIDRIIDDYERSFATLGFFDDHVFGLSHAAYMMENHVHFLRKDIPLPERIKNIPVCIVANGPSLSHDLPFLRKVQDKVIIIACGTAVETLYNEGIQPTFYACTERLRIVAEHLSLIPDKDFIKSCILLTADTTHPEVIKMFKDTAIFSKSDETFFWLAAAYANKDWSKVMPISMMNPLVGNMGVAAVTFLEFKNIYLFGVDNGTKRADKRTHPTENQFYKESDKSDATINALSYTLEGNFGGTVASSYVYKLSAKYMDVVMRYGVTKGIFYFNCSDGAKLENATPVHSEDLSWWYSLPDADLQGVRDFFNNEGTIDFKYTKEQLDELFKLENFEYVINTLIKFMTLKQRPKTRLEYVSMLQAVSEIIQQVRESKDIYVADMIDGSIDSMFAMLLRTLYLNESEEEAIKQTEDCLQFVLYFLEDCKKIYKFIPYYYAEDHHKFLDGKIGYDHENSKAPDIVKRPAYVTQADTDRHPVRKFVKRYE